jgi:hypothetical protein
LSKPFLTNLRLAPGDVKTRPSGFSQLTSLIFRFAKIYYQKRFNDRSNGFVFGQQAVEERPLPLFWRNLTSIPGFSPCPLGKEGILQYISGKTLISPPQLHYVIFSRAPQ